jgi:membrane protease subunit HflK
MAALAIGPGSRRDPHLLVVLALLGVSLFGAAAAGAGGLYLANPVILQAAVSLVLSSGILAGIALAQTARLNPPAALDLNPPALRIRLGMRALQAWRSIRAINFESVRHREKVSMATAAAGILGMGAVLLLDLPAPAPGVTVAAAAAMICIAAASLAATAVVYLEGIESGKLPESAELARGARVLAWIFLLAALSVGLAWAGQQRLMGIPQIVIALTNAAACYSLLTTKGRPDGSFTLDIGVLSVLGSRPNILGSALDSAEAQLGIDLRSTWALTVVRRSVEPLVIALCLMGWFSTSLTVVGVDEEGLVERLGVAVAGQSLQPGLHVHFPWPIDQVFRIPAKRVQAINVGHEGQEEGGPENVLWAVEHAANEYTLLLGNGRDLVTIDAAVQFRIADARAWQYNCQNPADALKAIAYRAVMRTTVNKTLADALSENVVTTTSYMRSLVQQDADALHLGVEVTGFTIGGMHPPVAVSSAYQGVVSAQVAKVTAVINAQVFRNQTVPAAQTIVVVNSNRAQADGANTRARAAGEAASFVTLDSQYRSEPQDYFFRRRLEKLEQDLAGRHFTVVDSRFQRDGGELWVIP